MPGATSGGAADRLNIVKGLDGESHQFNGNIAPDRSLQVTRQRSYQPKKR
jgi:hypothetical protein